MWMATAATNMAANSQERRHIADMRAGRELRSHAAGGHAVATRHRRHAALAASLLAVMAAVAASTAISDKAIIAA